MCLIKAHCFRAGSSFQSTSVELKSCTPGCGSDRCESGASGRASCETSDTVFFHSLLLSTPPNLWVNNKVLFFYKTLCYQFILCILSHFLLRRFWNCFSTLSSFQGSPQSQSETDEVLAKLKYQVTFIDAFCHCAQNVGDPWRLNLTSFRLMKQQLLWNMHWPVLILHRTAWRAPAVTALL